MGVQRSRKLWIYTNYDCNLRCSYCVAESAPSVPPRRLGTDTFVRLVSQARSLGFDTLYLTGGEPFLHPEIFDMIGYSAERTHTTILSNGSLLRGPRLERLTALAGDGLSVQISLDGALPEQHEAYRGAGTWQLAVEAIRRLRSAGVHVRIGTTVTPANAKHLEALAAFREELGVPESDHVLRPLARRGLAAGGLEVSRENLALELTVSVDGVFWHPLASPSSADMRITPEIFPFAAAASLAAAQAARWSTGPTVRSIR